MRRLDEIKDVFVPNVHLDDTPATGKSLGEGREALPSSTGKTGQPEFPRSPDTVDKVCDERGVTAD